MDFPETETVSRERRVEAVIVEIIVWETLVVGFLDFLLTFV